MRRNAPAGIGTHFLKAWRKHRGLTQANLAGRIDMAVGSISQLENQKQGYTQASLEAIAMELKCEPGTLLMHDPNSPNYQLWIQIAQMPDDVRPLAMQMLQLLEADRARSDR